MIWPWKILLATDVHLLSLLSLYVIYDSPTSGGNHVISFMLGYIESLRFLSTASTYCICIPQCYTERYCSEGMFIGMA